MALNNSGTNLTYVNISNGSLVIKNSNKEAELYTDITGKIYSVKFKMDRYNDKDFEVAQIYIIDGNQKYCLQMRTDSGYFRTLCNSIKSGVTYEELNLKPFIDDKEGKKKTVIFVKQNDKTLKHYHTQQNMGELPPIRKVTFKGKEQWDGTDQIEYWKNWLLAQKWHKLKEEATENIKSQNEKPALDLEIPDDLPF
jgi:hypothetical protein